VIFPGRSFWYDSETWKSVWCPMERTIDLMLCQKFPGNAVCCFVRENTQDSNYYILVKISGLHNSPIYFEKLNENDTADSLFSKIEPAVSLALLFK
jgi:hypothetical protein